MDPIDEILLGQIDIALMEDIGQGDITTLGCIGDEEASAEIIAKSDGILSGFSTVHGIFLQLDYMAEIEAFKMDGDYFSKGDRIYVIHALRSAIISGERTALNFLGHLSGIATLTSQFVEKVSGHKVIILDTRKTTPGFRILEKYAVSCGGGENHRFGLYDMALIKDNHIASCGSIHEAVKRIRKFLKKPGFKKKFLFNPSEIEIEVEVENEAQLREAIGLGIKRLLLDNQSIEQLAHLVKIARGLANDLQIEASGNVTLDNVAKVAATGIDFISIGALTHSAPSSDFSLKMLT
jgi:nicotinate-nucleotide pyrophosphorylase (carboxylating)